MKLDNILGISEAKNPIEFSEGSVIQSVYTGELYRVEKFYGNGMVLLYKIRSRATENWNACNNQHFIPADYISLAVKSLWVRL